MTDYNRLLCGSNKGHIGRKTNQMTRSMMSTTELLKKINDINTDELVKTKYVQDCDKHKTKEQKQKRENLMSDEFRHEYMISANTYSKMSFTQLNKLLQELSNRVNYQLNRYFRKQPDRRIVLHCFNQFVDHRVEILYDQPKRGGEYQKRHYSPNTHSHMISSIPKEFNTKRVFNLLRKCWGDLDTNRQKTFQLHVSKIVPKEDKRNKVVYATREYLGTDNEPTDKYFIPK